MGLDICVLGHPKILKSKKAYFNDEYDVYISGKEPFDTGISPGAYSGKNIYIGRIGSYGYYNEWRDFLEAFSRKHKHAPFMPLINNSDCEATFSTHLCQKLAKDFKTLRKDFIKELGYEEKAAEEAQSVLDPDLIDAYLETYDTFMKAFREASRLKGFVFFA